MAPSAAEPFGTHECDVLVVGAGGAGLRAAIAASELGAATTVVSKSLLGKAHTVMAEGGIAVALGGLDAEDDWETHFADTMLGGQLINDWRMVDIYAREVAERVHELERWGSVFDRGDDGRMMQRAFGAHSWRRLCHVGDRTGLELIRTLQDRVVAAGAVSIHMEHTLTNLLLDGERVVGALGYRRSDGGFVVYRAGAVVLAGGGWGRMYRHTSNSWEGVGDGAAMALEAGAELVDMEFVQFHPTGMMWPPGARGILVTEAVRGEGGHLHNREGRRFMVDHDPEKMELSSRDVVARAIHREVEAGRGSPHGGAYLDIRHRGAAHIRSRLPSMCEQFEALAGIDITREPMEVGPTIHYTMGGVRVEPQNGSTGVPGLYAAGEVTGGLHGANRLGGNSLGDILVFGRRAGMAAAGSAGRVPGGRGTPDPGVIAAAQRAMLAPLQAVSPGREAESPYRLHEKLQDAMQDDAGIARTEESLGRALQAITEIRERSHNVRVAGDRAFNPGWQSCRDLTCMLTVSEAIVRSALARRESRGAHWRLDFPRKDGNLRNHVVSGTAPMTVTPVAVQAMPGEVMARLSRSRFSPEKARP